MGEVTCILCFEAWIGVGQGGKEAEGGTTT